MDIQRLIIEYGGMMGLFRKIWFCLLTVCVLAAGTLSVSAAQATYDAEYYAPDYEAMTAAMSMPLANWKETGWFDVSQVDGAVRYQWTDAVQNVRLGSPKAMKADGLHVVFDNFSCGEGTSCNIALMLSMDAAYSEYEADMNYNLMARLPFALVIDPLTGTASTYASKALSTAHPGEVVHTIIENNKDLQAAALTGKQWEVRLDALSDDSYQVTINGVQAVIPLSYIVGPGSQIDLNACYFVLNTWGMDRNTLSLDLVALHGGESACADRLSDAERKQATAVMEKIRQIGTIVPDSKAAIEEARSAYESLSDPLKTLVTNMQTLTLAETVFPVVQAIDDIQAVTLSSAGELDEVEQAFLDLTDEEKPLVSNYPDFIEAKSRLLALQFEAGLTTTAATPPAVTGAESSSTRTPTSSTAASSADSTTASSSYTTAQSSESSSTATSERQTVPSGTEGEEDNRYGGLTVIVIAVGVVILAIMGIAAYVMMKGRPKNGSGTGEDGDR